jgi:hypothetical protein
MSIKQPVMVMAAAALFAVAGSASVSAQEDCGGLYNRMMGTYQTLGPQSPQYAQMYSYYNARCISGSSATPYQTPYGYQPPYAYQTPYAYQQPAPVDPGAAFLGGVVGGVVGEALEGDHRGRRYDDRWNRGW